MPSLETRPYINPEIHRNTEVVYAYSDEIAQFPLLREDPEIQHFFTGVLMLKIMITMLSGDLVDLPLKKKNTR